MAGPGSLADSALGFEPHTPLSTNSLWWVRPGMSPHVTGAMARSNASENTASPPNDADTSTKRKSEDASLQPRAKRNRYISIACNECKRRKIKCNGQNPCQRCGNLNLECAYAPNCCNNFKESDEFKQMSAHLTTLQQHVDDLYTSLNNLKTQVHVQTTNGAMGAPFTSGDYQLNSMLARPPLRPRSTSSTRLRYSGPTSTAFNLGVAKSSLRVMGITPVEAGDDDGGGMHDVSSRPTTPTSNAIMSTAPMHADKDPIWSISKQEALRLVRVWNEEQGLMYPIIDVDPILRYTEMLFSFVEAAARSGLMQAALPGADAIMDEQTSILKLILAIALVLEGRGKDALGEKLFDNIHGVVDKSLTRPVGLHGITLLVLTACYHFTRDDEALAWRVIGLAGRQCLELGLHRSQTYMTTFSDLDEQVAAIRVFWVTYILDRRWSFGTGMPFSMQDSDIDPDLPKLEPSTHDCAPYFNCMVAYSMIGSKIFKSVADATSQDTINKEDLSFLDFQVLNWHRSIPESLKYVHPDSGRQVEEISRAVHRLQIALYLRANQLRIYVYRPVLHTATTIMENLDFSHVAVKVAKDSIRVLMHVNQTTDIYRRQQTMFNAFLISALAVLFLAVAHAPVEFNQECRDEFYMALDLVRGLSSSSYVSRRLWKTIKTLKGIGPRLGLAIGNDDAADAHSSAAVAMAGLAGHNVDEMALFSNGQDSSGLGTPNGMASDLTTLFEAAGGAYNLNGYGKFDEVTQNAEYMNAFGQDDELGRIIQNLF